jgi:putative flippase GtrA
MREIVAYLFFGVLAALVNTVVYFAASWGFGLPAWLSTVVAFIFAVVFAFFTNKFWVFKNKQRGETARQAWQFAASRTCTMAIAAAAMLVFVDTLGWNEVVIYVLSQGFVTAANYIVGKFFIFRSIPE